MDTLAGLQRLKNGGSEFETQLGIDHRQQVVRWLAGHIAQKRARMLGNMEDLGFPVDQDARRCVVLDQPLMQIRERKAGGTRRRTDNFRWQRL
ncbi:hypothetical protein SB822_54605, partial [Paraburkholderia sp. SIMBA_054]